MQKKHRLHFLDRIQKERKMSSHIEIMKLEAEFWQAMADQRPEQAAALLAAEAVSVAMFGIHHFSPSEYLSMAQTGPAKLTFFEFSNEKVIFPITDVAVATYEVKQIFEMDGKSHEMICFDTTTWVRNNGRWLAAAHTETQKPNKAV